MEHYFINTLIAYCQRNGLLSTQPEKLLEQLEDLMGYDCKEEIEEILDSID